MCGFCGFVGDARRELIEPMTRAITHRGPDDSGTWHEPQSLVTFGHRRLSIIDLSPAGHQPMTNEDGSIWLIFNGEIYDFEDHRNDLQKRGHQLRSRTDSEVLIHLYEEYGPAFLERINGMFALAIWDMNQRQLFMARDHAGIKPLYYWHDSRRIFFGSEIKSLLRVPDIPREMDRELIQDVLTFLAVPGERTLLKGIRKLEPGSWLIWKDGQIQTRRWFSLPFEPDETVTEREWIDQVHDTFMRTTRRQMVSDVPLGAYLSGGVDSSSIVACMRKSFPNRDITCYTTHFAPEDIVRDQFEDDYPFAKTVADRLGVTLKSFVLRPDMIALLPKMVYHLDEPDTDPAVFPSYLISKLAREDGTTVLLSGTGGDEVFFGYRSHQAYGQYARLNWFPSALGHPLLSAATAVSSRMVGAQSAATRRMRKFNSAWVSDPLQRHLALVDWTSPETRASVLTQGAGGNGQRRVPPAMQTYFDNFEGTGELNRHSHILIQSFLAAHNFLYTDKSSMAVSVEVRVPFMDLELMRLCARIPERYKLNGNITKYVLKKAMEPYIGWETLNRSKTGFGVPLRKWIAEDLQPYIRDLLSPQKIAQRGLFEPAFVTRAIRENDANTADHAYLIYSLLTLEVWMQTFIDQPAVEVTW